jgi:hypothetical protein
MTLKCRFSHFVLAPSNGLTSAFITMMIRAFQNAALFLVLVSCCTIKSAAAAEQNDLNKVLSAVILEMNNEGVFAEYWYVMMCIACCRLDLVLRLRF